MEAEPREQLKDHHTPERIRRRISAESGQNYLGDAVLGAIDGGITSFAVVAGAVGGQLSALVVLVLGFASLLADGFSMAVSNYLSTKSKRESAERLRQQEHAHIEAVPDEQRRELRMLLEHQGLSGEGLERAEEGIRSNRELWARMVVRDVYGVPMEGTPPVRAALATMFAFVFIGTVPLVPFLIAPLSMQQAFVTSAAITALTFFAVGVIKGRVVGSSLFGAGVETLLVGGGAAVLAYAVGYGIRQAVTFLGLA